MEKAKAFSLMMYLHISELPSHVQCYNVGCASTVVRPSCHKK